MSDCKLDAIEARAKTFANGWASAESLRAFVASDVPAIVARVRDLEERCLRLAEEVVNKTKELDETDEELKKASDHLAALGVPLVDDDDGKETTIAQRIHWLSRRKAGEP